MHVSLYFDVDTEQHHILIRLKHKIYIKTNANANTTKHAFAMVAVII